MDWERARGDSDAEKMEMEVDRDWDVVNEGSDRRDAQICKRLSRGPNAFAYQSTSAAAAAAASTYASSSSTYPYLPIFLFRQRALVCVRVLVSAAKTESQVSLSAPIPGGFTLVGSSSLSFSERFSLDSIPRYSSDTDLSFASRQWEQGKAKDDWLETHHEKRVHAHSIEYTFPYLPQGSHLVSFQLRATAVGDFALPEATAVSGAHEDVSGASAAATIRVSDPL